MYNIQDQKSRQRFISRHVDQISMGCAEGTPHCMFGKLKKLHKVVFLKILAHWKLEVLLLSILEKIPLC